MWASCGPVPYFKCSKTVKVGFSCYEFKFCQRVNEAGEIQEENLGDDK